MSILRINYTGRLKIKQSDINIVLSEDNGHAKFDAFLNFQNYNFPENSHIFIEAYRQTSWMRFDFGTVNNYQPPDIRYLYEFDSTDCIKFRVKITSEKGLLGRLFAEADKIRPKNELEKENNRVPLLDVRNCSLENQVYRLEFVDKPTLLINKEIGDWKRVTKEPAFVSLVLPNIFQEILTRILIINEYTDTDDTDDWQSQWLKFAVLLPGISEPPKENNNREDWIEKAVESFCRKFNIITVFKEYWIQEVLK